MVPSEQALNTHLSTMSPAPRVAWPNVNPVVLQKPYLQVHVFRNVPTSETLKSGERHPGIYQVTVVGREGMGTEEAEDLALQVAARFPKNTRLPTSEGTVRVYLPPHVAGGIPDQGQWRVPVSIYYATRTV